MAYAPRTHACGRIPFRHDAQLRCAPLTHARFQSQPQLWRTQGRHHASVRPQAVSDQRTPVVEALASFDEVEFVCDQPVCTPAIAQTLRALSQDIRRLRYGPNQFSRDVKYTDGVRSFQGNSRFNRTQWAAQSVQEPKASISSMRIVDSARAQIDWRLTGSVAGVPIDIAVVTSTEHSLVTGKVQTHKESWDLSRCSVPAKVAVTASRLAWATTQAGLDLSEGLDNVSDKVQGALDSMEGDNDVTRDPTDPNKFFQAEGNKNADLWQVCTLLAVLYLVYTAWTEVEKLG